MCFIYTRPTSSVSICDLYSSVNTGKRSELLLCALVGTYCLLVQGLLSFSLSFFLSAEFRDVFKNVFLTRSESDVSGNYSQIAEQGSCVITYPTDNYAIGRTSRNMYLLHKIVFVSLFFWFLPPLFLFFVFSFLSFFLPSVIYFILEQNSLVKLSHL